MCGSKVILALSYSLIPRISRGRHLDAGSLPSGNRESPAILISICIFNFLPLFGEVLDIHSHYNRYCV